MRVKKLVAGPIATNCYILTNDALPGHALVVDPGAEPKKIARALEDDRLICDAILLTHTHFDHFDALDSLAALTGAKLFCPAKDEAGLRDPLINGSVMLLRRKVTSETNPSRLLKEGDVIPFGGETLTVLETPGHTAGSVCFDTGKELFTGDTLFSRGCGRTDLPGGSEEQLRFSLKKLFALGQRAVYPGHGETTTLSFERAIYGL